MNDPVNSRRSNIILLKFTIKRLICVLRLLKLHALVVWRKLLNGPDNVGK